MAAWFKEIDFGESLMSRLLCRFSFQWTTECGPFGSYSFVHWKLIAHGLGVWITDWICMFRIFEIPLVVTISGLSIFN